MALPARFIDVRAIGHGDYRHARQMTLVQRARITVLRRGADGDDFIPDMLARSDRACMALHRPRVLLLTRDAGVQGVTCCGQKHAWVARRIGREGGAVVGDCRFAGMARAMLADRCAAPCFDAAGDDNLGVAGGEHAMSQRDGVESGAALTVDRQGWNPVSETGRQRQHARRVSACAHGVAGDHGVDGGQWNAEAPQDALHDGGGDFMRLQPR